MVAPYTAGSYSSLPGILRAPSGSRHVLLPSRAMVRRSRGREVAGIDSLDVLPDVIPELPSPRGVLSDFLTTHLRRPPHELPPAPDAVDDALFGDDSALALYIAYELHYRSFAEVDDKWEWEPSLLGLRARLEAALEQRLVDQVAVATASI